MKKIATLSLAIACTFGLRAQLTVTGNLSVTTIAALLEGPGVTVSNVEVVCEPGAIAMFSGPSELEIYEGLMLTTGLAASVVENSSYFAAFDHEGPGDPDLEALLQNSQLKDACAVEFDCVPGGDTLLFNYSFGSEEYHEFVGLVNDAFAIFLDGPEFLEPMNVATLPGGTYVSINNVNNGFNSAYFYDNEDPDGQFVCYDGFTVNLTAFAQVTPGSTYHVKAVIADADDGVWDSAVFLEAFSFRSPSFTGITPSMSSPFRLILNGSTLELVAPGASPNAQVELIDAAGRVVHTYVLPGERGTIDIGALPQGAYAARIVSGDAQGVARFVKN